MKPKTTKKRSKAIASAPIMTKCPRKMLTLIDQSPESTQVNWVCTPLKTFTQLLPIDLGLMPSNTSAQDKTQERIDRLKAQNQELKLQVCLIAFDMSKTKSELALNDQRAKDAIAKYSRLIQRQPSLIQKRDCELAVCREVKIKLSHRIEFLNGRKVAFEQTIAQMEAEIARLRQELIDGSPIIDFDQEIADWVLPEKWEEADDNADSTVHVPMMEEPFYEQRVGSVGRNFRQSVISFPLFNED